MNLDYSNLTAEHLHKWDSLLDKILHESIRHTRSSTIGPEVADMHKFQKGNGSFLVCVLELFILFHSIVLKEMEK